MYIEINKFNNKKKNWIQQKRNQWNLRQKEVFNNNILQEIIKKNKNNNKFKNKMLYRIKKY